MGRVTDTGYIRTTLQEILTSMKSNVRSKLGEDWNTEVDSPEGQFIAVFAEELDQLEQGTEAVVAAQTLNGAEGIHLDDLLSQQGVYRQGKTAGSGQAIVFSNLATVSLGSSVPTTSSASALNNVTYQVQQSVTIDNYMSCYKLSASQLSVGVTYTFAFYNINSPSTKTFIRTVISDTDKDRALQELVVFANDNILDTPVPAYYSAQTRTLYIAFNQNNNLPIPFVDGQLYVSASPRAGSVGHRIILKANTLGFNPLAVNSLVALSPTYAGYESIVNWDDFNSGSEVQTDAEYLISAQNIKDTSIAGTPDALKSALLRIEGVVDAEVYENPSENFIYDISNNVVCQPYTYNVAVLGGDDLEVAQTIYLKGYGNTKRYGTYSSVATNAKDESVAINFTRVSYFDTAVDIKYRTKDNSVLNETEKSTIIENIRTTISEFKIGDYVVVKLLEAIIYQSVQFGRLKDVQVSIKDLTLPSAAFTTSDLLADYDEKPRVLVDNITLGRM